MKHSGRTIQFYVCSQKIISLSLCVYTLLSFDPSTCLLTRELQSEALLAGEEVRGELQGDGVEGAVRVLRQRRAAQLPEEDPSFVRTVPNPKHIMDLLRVENQEMQTVEKSNRMLNTYMGGNKALDITKWDRKGSLMIDVGFKHPNPQKKF